MCLKLPAERLEHRRCQQIVGDGARGLRGDSVGVAIASKWVRIVLAMQKYLHDAASHAHAHTHSEKKRVWAVAQRSCQRDVNDDHGAPTVAAAAAATPIALPMLMPELTPALNSEVDAIENNTREHKQTS